MRLLPLALLGLLVAAAPASAAFSYKAFRTPSGNISCAGTGDLSKTSYKRFKSAIGQVPIVDGVFGHRWGSGEAFRRLR